ncbi:MAG: hypothetical protein Q4B81_01795 [Moraxella sp.]|nr:hypothetical protein [Moraxella sp.]
MKKSVCVALSLALMASACSKKEESPIEKAQEAESVPMSAEPAEPTARPVDDGDAAVIEPVDATPAADAQSATDDNGQALTSVPESETEEEIIESVDNEIPPESAQ